ncbi:MAG: SUF system NifU family Fe-S cluster assembly protein [Acidobacteriia bacterium]|nr:SUF system NifU family Fe-S cluster assembly protein [Terriglobia bacterium]
MPDLRELYQEVILDHHKRPRNFRRPEDANKHADGFNPLCGDKVTVFVRMENGIVRDIAFQGSGCAISTASASMMTESLKGKSETEVAQIFQRFHDLVTGRSPADADSAGLGKLAVFSGVREYPVRVKCATLAWHTMRAALEGSQETVATE